MKLGRERGATIPRSEAIASIEALGRALQRAYRAIPAWSEELTAAAQSGGGLAAVSGLLRAKAAELGDCVENLITAFADDAEWAPDRSDAC
jgi:predicted NBD/HSP70 family sugar kinase